MLFPVLTVHPGAASCFQAHCAWKQQRPRTPPHMTNDRRAVLCLCTHRKEIAPLTSLEWWPSLRAVKEGRVVLVDGNQMFNRPGPRLVDALEFLACLLRGDEGGIPDGFPWERL